MGERPSIKVTQPFLDWLQDDVLKSKFPIKTKTQFVTLCSKYWWKLWENADQETRNQMMETMQDLRDDCESNGHLQNSREIEIVNK